MILEPGIRYGRHSRWRLTNMAANHIWRTLWKHPTYIYIYIYIYTLLTKKLATPESARGKHTQGTIATPESARGKHTQGTIATPESARGKHTQGTIATPESARGKHTQGTTRVTDYPNDAQALPHTKLLKGCKIKVPLYSAHGRVTITYIAHTNYVIWTAAKYRWVVDISRQTAQYIADRFDYSSILIIRNRKFL